MIYIHKPCMFLKFLSLLLLQQSRPKIKDNVNGEQDKVNGKQNQASGKETGDYTMAAFKSRGQITFKMYTVTCKQSSGNFEHNFV